MARAAASSLAEDLVCPICLAIFQEPHMLSCGHNFCLACLQSCVPGWGVGGTCPECRLPFQLRELTRNRALANVAKKVRRFTGDQEEPLLGAAAAALENFCEDHDEPLKLFCLQDRLPICVICRDLPQHRGHVFLPTTNAVQYAQGKLKPYQKLLKKKLQYITNNESLQEEEIAALESLTEYSLGEISSGFEVLHQILHAQEENFKKTVQEMKEENLKMMKDNLLSLKEDGALHTEKLTKIEAALVTTDHIAFLKDFKDLMDKVKKYPQEEEEDGESSGDDEEGEACDKVRTKKKGECSEEKETRNIEEAFEIECQEDEEEEEEEEEKEEVQVIQVDSALQEFMDSLDFEAWKEMLLNHIKAGEENKQEGETSDESARCQLDGSFCHGVSWDFLIPH